jgi:hypothetical protein
VRERASEKREREERESERESERERESESESERESETESCVCECVLKYYRGLVAKKKCACKNKNARCTAALHTGQLLQ